MLLYLILLTFLSVSPLSLSANCGKQTLSCPVDLTFLKEVEAFSESSQQAVEKVLETKAFQNFVAGINPPAQLVTPGTASTPLNPSELYVFVSFSMGEKALLSLAQEVKMWGATIVLRGFKENSLRKTITALHEIILKTGQGVLIDPELFSLFKVTAVPTFILAKPFPFQDVKRTQTPLHDRLQGHVSTQYALEMFAKQGDLKDEAKILLREGGAL